MKKIRFCVVLLLLITAVSCTSQGEDYQVKNPTQGPTVYTYDPNWTPMPAPTDANGKEVTGNPYEYVNPDRLFNKGEWMDMCGMQFRFNSVKFTKAIDGIDPEKIDAFNFNRSVFGRMVDKEGNLYGDYSYVVMNVDAKNVSEEEIVTSLGFLLVSHIKDSMNTSAFWEYRENSKEIERDDRQEDYIFQPGEEVNITLYGWIKDCNIDEDTLYFYIPNYAVDAVPDGEGTQYLYSVWVPINRDKSDAKIYDDYDDVHEYINPERLYNIGETAEMKGMSFRVNGVTKGKTLEGIDVNKVRYNDYEKTILKSDGTFGETRIYVTANITIKNLSDQEKELCLGAIYLSTGGHIDPLVGASGVTPSMTEDLQYDDFYRFAPGEEVTFNVYLVQHDRILTDDRLFIQFPITMGLLDADTPVTSYDEVTYEYDIFVPIDKDKNEVNIYEEWHAENVY